MPVSEQSPRQGRILVVTDLSGVGRCAAMVAVPVISLSGSNCALLPTAVFSTHTGGFGQVHRRDMTPDMKPILAHWLDLGLRFDAVFVSYVANERQLNLLEDALPSLLGTQGKLYLDPVMGDHGRRYAFCGEALVEGFARLCRVADTIFPNRTEAALLMGVPLRAGEEPPPPAAEDILALGAKNAVVTGVRDETGQVGVMAAMFGSPDVYQTFRKHYEGAYPGAGDLLASCIVSALALGAALPRACDIACDFLDESLSHTARYRIPSRFGLVFEQALPRLSRVFEALKPT
ncbi:MAG: bifunctional hydroxymethylpyrimidine kinase/phosphomethylpyrimidine kinase [Christensenellales bacterium]|jgi:pyridoxine kinase